MDDRDPLRPIEVTTRVLLLLLGGVLLAGVALAVVLPGQAGGPWDGQGCVTTTSDVVRLGEGQAAARALLQVPDAAALIPGLAPGSEVSGAVLTFCDPTPAVWQQAVGLVRDLVPLAAFAGFLVLVRVLVRQARRAGLFSPDVARTVRGLGWYLLGAAVVTAVATAAADAALLGAVVPRRSAWAAFDEAFDVPLATVLAGIGVLTIARVLRRAVAMREDLDATI